MWIGETGEALHLLEHTQHVSDSPKKSSESIVNKVAQIFDREDVELAQKFCHFSQVRREGWKRKRFDKKVPRARVDG